MKRLLIALCLLPSWAGAATYYVDCAAGAGGDGSLATPWDAIADVNAASFSAGDSVLLKKGCTFRETLTVPSSGSAGNPITFGAYGAGAAPILDGSDLIVPGTSWAAAASWQDGMVYTSSGNAATVNSRNTMPANTSPVSGTKIRITVKAGSAVNLTLLGASIGVMSATSVFDSDPTRITFSGANGATVTAGQTLVSDEITFTFDKTVRYGIHIATNADANSTVNINAVNGSYWTYSGDQTMVLNPTINGSSATVAYGMTKVEVYSGTANAWMSAVTTEPQIVFFDETKGTKETAVANLSTAREWFWAGNVLYVYSATDPDTAYTAPGIEAGARNNGIVASDKNYVVVDGLSSFGTNSHLIDFEGSVTGNVIRNCSASYNGTNAGIIWWVTGGTGTNTVDACTIHHTAGDGVTWFDVYSGSGTESYLKNSTIYNTGAFGGYLKANYLIVEHNTVYDCGTSGTANWGLGLQAEADDAGTGLNNIVRYNRISGTVGDDTDADGLQLDHWTGSNHVYYNVIYGNDGRCITNYDSASNAIYNNTCYGNAQRATLTVKAEILVSGTASKLSDNVLIKNNAVIATAANVYAIYVDANSFDQTPTITNNAWTAAATNWYFWNAGGGNVLATWNALTGVGTDLNSDPLMMSPQTRDFHLQNTSPAIDAGVLVGLTTDYAGNPMVGRMPDIGAYENQYVAPVIVNPNVVGGMGVGLAGSSAIGVWR